MAAIHGQAAVNGGGSGGSITGNVMLDRKAGYSYIDRRADRFRRNRSGSSMSRYGRFSALLDGGGKGGKSGSMKSLSKMLVYGGIMLAVMFYKLQSKAEAGGSTGGVLGVLHGLWSSKDGGPPVPSDAASVGYGWDSFFVDPTCFVLEELSSVESQGGGGFLSARRAKKRKGLASKRKKRLAKDLFGYYAQVGASYEGYKAQLEWRSVVSGAGIDVSLADGSATAYPGGVTGELIAVDFVVPASLRHVERQLEMERWGSSQAVLDSHFANWTPVHVDFGPAKATKVSIGVRATKRLLSLGGGMGRRDFVLAAFHETADSKAPLKKSKMSFLSVTHPDFPATVNADAVGDGGGDEDNGGAEETKKGKKWKRGKKGKKGKKGKEYTRAFQNVLVDLQEELTPAGTIATRVSVVASLDLGIEEPNAVTRWIYEKSLLRAVTGAARNLKKEAARWGSGAEL
jgi:hypothetical protein